MSLTEPGEAEWHRCFVTVVKLYSAVSLFNKGVILLPSGMSYQPHADVDFIRDTAAEALSVFYEIQRKRPAGQKLIDVFDLSEGLFETAKAGVRIRYPLAGEREVFLRAVASRVPPALMIQAYGWDPALHE